MWNNRDKDARGGKIVVKHIGEAPNIPKEMSRLGIGGIIESNVG